MFKAQQSSRKYFSYELKASCLSSAPVSQNLDVMNHQMRLLVGEGDSRIEIDTVPQVMANASPVFRSMLQPDRIP